MTSQAPGLFSEDELGASAGALAALLGVFSLAGPGTTGQQQLIAQRSLMDMRSTLLGTPELMEAYRRGIVDSPQLAAVLSRAGYTDTVIQIMQRLAHQQLASGEVLELYRRKTIDRQTAETNLAHLGYDPNNIEAMLSLAYYVPTAQDVISFAVREVYNPEVAERFGQFQDFPDAGLPDFERAGLTRKDAEKYWAAHWTLPSVNMGFDMLHRNAETGVTVDDLQKLLQANDVMPFWRDKIIAISTSPFTRVDIRRMNKVGILDEAAVNRAYRDIGYNEERAKNLTDFTLKLNEGTEAEELKPFAAQIRTRAEAMYLDGLITAAELEEHLNATGINDAQVAAYIAEAEFMRVNNAQKVVREAIRKAYESGRLTDAQATERLKADGHTDAQIVPVMATWHVVRELRELSTSEHAERDLTKAETLAAYSDHLVTAEATIAHLKQLGYDDAEAALFVAMSDLKRTKAERTAAEHVQHQLYVSRRITSGEASKGLVEAQVDPARIQQLLKAWTFELDAKAPTLTKAEIGHAIAGEFITPADGVERLTALGYAPTDVRIIVQLATKGVVDVSA